jgi:response regulator receiver modulated metal dependent phosphohydrolase
MVERIFGVRIKNIINEKENDLKRKILVIDDEQGVIDSLKVYLGKEGYIIEGETDPLLGIEKVRNNYYDILILDYIMIPINGDKVIEEIRKFNKDIYIIVLTGHKSVAPPIETIRRLNIQGYLEKTNKFEQILLMIESSVKSIIQLEEIKKKNKEIEETYIESIETLRKIVEAKDNYTLRTF